MRRRFGMRRLSKWLELEDSTAPFVGQSAGDPAHSGDPAHYVLSRFLEAGHNVRVFGSLCEARAAR